MTQPPQPQSNTILHYSVEIGDLNRHKIETLAVWHDGGFVEHATGDSARFDWFYQDNPAGPGQLSLLRCNSGPPVGALGACPRQFVVNDRQVLAGVLVDFVVHPAHRTALPALQLQKAARARALKDMGFLYGLPDTKAIATFKRLGYTVHFEVPRYARVLQTGPYLRRIMSPFVAHPAGFLLDSLDAALLHARVSIQRWVNTAFRDTHAAWADEIGEEFEQLWADFAKETLCIGVRDARFIRWRFGGRPGFCYRTLVVRHSSTKRLCAYFICEIGENGITIKDCLSLGGRTEWLHALNLLCVEARRLLAPVLHVDIAAPEHVVEAFRSAGFRRRSARHFFAMVGDVGLSGAAWYITQADEDV
jgi:hypothetical protein